MISCGLVSRTNCAQNGHSKSLNSYITIGALGLPSARGSSVKVNRSLGDGGSVGRAEAALSGAVVTTVAELGKVGDPASVPSVWRGAAEFAVGAGGEYAPHAVSNSAAAAKNQRYILCLSERTQSAGSIPQQKTPQRLARYAALRCDRCTPTGWQRLVYAFGDSFGFLFGGIKFERSA